MFDIKPDDLVSKTDQLLFSILEELKQLNKSLHPMRKDTVIKKKPRSKNSTKPKPEKRIELAKTDSIIGGVSNCQ